MARVVYTKEAKKEPSQKTVQELIVEFLQYQNANARSVSTFKTYSNSLHVFQLWLEECFPNGDVLSSLIADSEFIDRYIIWLRDVRLNNENTVKHHKSQLRVFVYWCQRKEYVASYDIIVKTPQEEIPETYTDAELKKLTKKPVVKDDFTENRDWTIIQVMLATGNRRATICGYAIKDVDFDDGFLIMNRTKNKRAQRLPIEKGLVNVLREYIAAYRSNCATTEPLFPSIDGRFLIPVSLTHSICNYNRRRGIEKTGVHMFRHTFAKLFIKKGGDISQLKNILGHSSLAMTEKYLRLFGDELRPYLNRFSPSSDYLPQVREYQRIGNRRKGRL